MFVWHALLSTHTHTLVNTIEITAIKFMFTYIHTFCITRHRSQPQCKDDNANCMHSPVFFSRHYGSANPPATRGFKRNQVETPKKKMAYQSRGFLGDPIATTEAPLGAPLPDQDASCMLKVACRVTVAPSTIGSALSSSYIGSGRVKMCTESVDIVLNLIIKIY